MSAGPFPATLTAAGLLTLLLLALAIQCVLRRFQEQKARGTDVEPARKATQNAMRVMANFTEYVPLALILILGLEAARAAGWLVYTLAGTLVLGRLLHAYGLSRHAGTSPGRFLGTVLTWTVLLVAALAALWLALAAGL